MKCLVFLMMVAAATAAFVPFSETTGKPLAQCNGKNSFQRTFNVPHETDCSKFYKCLGRYGFEIDCPTLKGVKLLFNEELQVCDWEGGSNCQGTSEPSGTTSSGSSTSEASSTSSGSSTSEASSTSSAASAASEASSPSSASSSSATSPSSSSSADTTTQNNSTENTEVPEPDCADHPELKKPHPDKHKYYQCENGVPKIKTCWAGSFFNVVIGECDLLRRRH